MTLVEEIAKRRTFAIISHPDAGKRVSFSAGTSISYNYIDFRFKNVTDQNFQLILWCENEKLFGELRSEYEIPYS